MTIQIACDGSSIQQGDFRKGDETFRPGAAGFVAKLPDGATVGKAEHTANGLIGGMEVKALRMGLEFAAAALERRPELRGRPIEIVCDSQYAVNGFNEWLKGWAEKGYHKKGGLANADEWRTIDGLKKDLGSAVQVVWTKGHADHALNNAVDQLVNNAARTQRSFDDTHRYLAGGSTEKRTVEPAISAEPNSGGIRAQAAALLAQAAEDPRLAKLVADSLSMGLNSNRVSGPHDAETLTTAQSLQAVLDRRGAER